jgi:hypothetical protein
MHGGPGFDYADLGIPLVLCGRPVTGADTLSYVDADNVGGACTAVRCLLDRGRKAVATIAGPPDMAPGIDRLVGYREAMAAQGLDRPDPGLIAYGDFSRLSGEHALFRLSCATPPSTSASTDLTGDQRRSAAIPMPSSGLAVPVGCGPDPHSTPKPCDDGEQDSCHSGQQQRNPKRHVAVSAKVANVHAAAVFQDEDQQEQQDDGEERQGNPRPADPGRFCLLLSGRLRWCLGSGRMLLRAATAMGSCSHEHSRPFLSSRTPKVLIFGVPRGSDLDQSSGRAQVPISGAGRLGGKPIGANN